jgi:hypothetical protein
MINPGRILTPIGLALAIVMALPAAPAAALTADEVRQRISTEFGVRVLKVRPGRLDGRSVFLVTVMNPGGDFNEAFQVTVLAVDAATGKMVPAFRHLPSGRRVNQAPSHEPNRQPADTFRRGRSWR